MSTPQNHPTLVYKILTRSQHASWRSSPTHLFSGAPIDLADGYIHLSTAATAGETYARYFADGPDAGALVVAEIDLTALGDAEVRWEESRGGELFPHVYGGGGLPWGAVRRVWEGGEVGAGLFEGLVKEGEGV